MLQRASQNCRVVRVFSAEKRSYNPSPRISITSESYNCKRNSYNRSLKREARRVNVRVLDLRVPWLCNESAFDGIHFNSQGRINFVLTLS